MSLQRKTLAPDFADLIDQAMTAQDEIAALSEHACRRENANAFLYGAIQIAGSTREEIEQLDDRIAALPPAPIWDALRVFVDAIYRHAIDPFGYSCAPQVHEMPREQQLRIPDAVISSALLEMGATRAQLSAVAILRATREHPEIFERGCDDIDDHEAKIAAAEARAQAGIEKASRSWQWERDTLCTGGGRVAFKLSDGATDIGNGPGDTDAIVRLIRHLREQRAAQSEAA